MNWRWLSILGKHLFLGHSNKSQLELYSGSSRLSHKKTVTDTPMCKVTKENITTEASEVTSVGVLIKIKDTESGGYGLEPGTCVIR